MPIQLGRRSYHKDVYAEPRVTLTVGNFCQLGRGLFVLGGGERHVTSAVSCFPWKSIGWAGGTPITPAAGAIIENDVWVGARVTLMYEVTIGNGAIVGANALVTKDVPPYAVVGGVPARIIKYRFDPDTIAKLLQIAWWHWPDEKIQAELAGGCFNDVAAFVRRHA